MFHLLLLVLGLATVFGEVEQVHLSIGHDPTSMMVTWITDDSLANQSSVKFGKSASTMTHVATGKTTQYTQHCQGARTPTYNYTSGIIHHTLLTGLEYDTTYYYQIPGLGTYDSFKTLVADDVFPYIISVVGDLGQTVDSENTVSKLAIDIALDSRLIVSTGDYAYADCDQNRWDKWGRMMDPLLRKVAWLGVAGNHEIELDKVNVESFNAYKHRFAYPESKPTEDTTTAKQFNQTEDCTASVFTGSYDYGNSFYMARTGSIAWIFLNSYTETDSASKQYKWLVETLSSIDRSQVPWVFVDMHAPWYNTNTAHQNERNSIQMRASMEDVFRKFGVNAVFSGHVHAYERTHPVYLNKIGDPYAPTYINIGDGGNREGHADRYLPNVPDWSAFRDGTDFGHGTLIIHNKTHVEWQWKPNDGGGVNPQDIAWILNQVELDKVAKMRLVGESDVVIGD